MSDPKFENIGTPEDKAIEECSELIKEICKARRFGYFNFHPAEPNKKNIDRILSEIDDVRKTLNVFENKLMTMREVNITNVNSDAEFIEEMRSYRVDHGPDGWPAIRQKDLDRLIDIIFKVANNDDGRLTVHILKHWDREKIDSFAKHLLGDKCQGCRER